MDVAATFRIRHLHRDAPHVELKPERTEPHFDKLDSGVGWAGRRGDWPRALSSHEDK